MKKVTSEDFDAEQGNRNATANALILIGKVLCNIRDGLVELHSPLHMNKIYDSMREDRLQRVKNRLCEKITNENLDEIAKDIVDIFEV